MSKKEIIKTGTTFNRLTVIKEISPYTYKEGKGRKRRFLFKCNCGNKAEANLSSVKIGNTKSCGCLNNELRIKRKTTHNLSKSRIYKTWKTIRERCNNKNNKAYKHYGGRGIICCKRWDKFENFYYDMGKEYNLHIKKYRRKNTTIDRIDNDGNYEPKNCKWATLKEQANNKRTSVFIEYKNKKMNISQWSKYCGIPQSTISKRLMAECTLEEIFSTKRLNAKQTHYLRYLPREQKRNKNKKIYNTKITCANTTQTT